MVIIIAVVTVIIILIPSGKAYILIVWLIFYKGWKEMLSASRKSVRISVKHFQRYARRIPNITESFKSFTRGDTGRPWLGHNQQDLMAVVIKIVQNSSTADERHQTECMRIMTTLDDLTTELRKLGYILSHSAVYLR